MNQLQKFSGFKAELAIAETLEEIKFLESKAVGAAEFAKRNKIGLDVQNQWGRFRVEIEDKKGAWLDKMFPHGATKENPHNSKVKLPGGKLKKMPVTPKESSNARLVHNEPELREEVNAEIEEKGDVITPSKVSSEIRKKKKIKDHKNLQPLPIPKGVYRILYVDPPWQYRDKQDTELRGGAEKHYPTMSLTDLCNMELPELEDNAVLFLWVTSPMLEDAFKVINAWKFKYKTSFVWNKVKHNMGYYNSVRHELLLIATRGSCLPDYIKLFNSVQTIERSDTHSEKPEKFREIIDTLYTKGNRIELFARKEHDGWGTWGNEI